MVAFLVGSLSSDTPEEPVAVDQPEIATTSTVIQTTTTSTTLPEIDLEVKFDAGITPSVTTVPPLTEGGAPRAVGRIVTDGGVASEIVVGEMVVVVPDEAALEDIRQWEEIEVLDFEIDPEAVEEEGIEVLLRIKDPNSIDVSTVAWDFEAMEPSLSGVLTIDSEATAATAVVLHRLANETDLEPAFNSVLRPHDVDDGQLLESFQEQLNAFDWSYVKSDAPQGIGLDTAWQMLYHHGKAGNRVTVLVIDNGFVQNGDFPENAKIRKGDWGPEPDNRCTNNTPCPYHGTQVALTVAGQHDNLWGTAGVAAPWVHLVVMPTFGDAYHTMKQAKRVIREEKPDVVNMSFGMLTTTKISGTKRQYDRAFRIARKYHDVLAIASAGNEGINIDTASGLYLPCASKEVICVGGMGVDTTERHDGSNYGSIRDEWSVEIYGPFCTYGYVDPGDLSNGDSKLICGTSFSSPFVAGVAALLRVADPGISPERMKEILYNTAHVGDLGPLVTGHQRRIDAHMAVAEALGVTWTEPTVTIATEGGSFPVEEVISLEGSAMSYTQEPIPLRWHSNIDGWLNDVPSMSSIGAVLSPGQHLIQAVAIDRRGLSGNANVVIEIDNEPPVVTIVNPTDGTSIYEGSALHMIAYTHDPDPFINEALAEEDVHWTISAKDSGSVIWETDGHVAVTALNPGDYVITLAGTDRHGSNVEDSVEIEVLELEPGWVPPTASIIKPNTDLSLGVGNNTVEVELQGLAKGVDGNTISGRRFRWTATSDTGHTFTICTGSNFPGTGGGGGFVIPVDCKNTTGEFGLAAGAVGRTVWAVKLEAVDNQGVSVEAVRHVEVVFAAS